MRLQEFQYALVMLLVEYHADESEQRRPISTDDNILQVLREDAVGNEVRWHVLDHADDGTSSSLVSGWKQPLTL